MKKQKDGYCEFDILFEDRTGFKAICSKILIDLTSKLDEEAIEDKEMIKNLWPVVPGKGYISGEQSIEDKEQLAKTFNAQYTKDGQTDCGKQKKYEGYYNPHGKTYSADAFRDGYGAVKVPCCKDEKCVGNFKKQENEKPTRAMRKAKKLKEKKEKIIKAINLLSDACVLKIIEPGVGLVDGADLQQFCYFVEHSRKVCKHLRIIAFFQHHLWSPFAKDRKRLQLTKKIIKFLKRNKKLALEIVKEYAIYYLFCIKENPTSTWKIKFPERGKEKYRWEFNREELLIGWTKSALEFFNE